MPSLVKTLPRCHSTVRGLMNSWLPISWLVRPSRASLVIWDSWAVSSVSVSTVRLRTVSPVASSSNQRGGRCQSATRLRPPGRALQLGGNRLVWSLRSVGAMPGPPFGIDLRIGGLGQCVMCCPPVTRGGCLVDRGAPGSVGYLLSPATTLIVTAIITAPNTKEINACRSTVTRMIVFEMAVSEI